MAYSVTYNSIEKIVEAQVQGSITLQEVKEITSEVMKVCKEQNCFVILNDLREAKVKLSALEIYYLPKTFSEMAITYGLEIHKLKRAFIASKGQENLNFFETVTVNRAQNARYFFDIDEARSWLLGK